MGRQRVLVLACAISASVVCGLAASGRDAQAGVLEVRVQDDRRAPLAGARVSAWRGHGSEWDFLARATTNEDGRSSLQIPGGGECRILVSARGFRRAERDVAESGLLEVRLERGRQLVVAVQDAVTGRPISSFTMLALPAALEGIASQRLSYALEGLEPASFSEEHGKAILGGLDEGPVTLAVRAPGYPLRVLPNLRPGADPLVIELDPTGCVERRVVDGATGAPVVNAVAAPNPSLLEDELLRLASLPRSDELGRLVLCPLPGVATDLLIFHPDFAPVLIPAPTESGPAQSGVPIRLDRGGAVEGAVQDKNGQPERGALVRTRTLGIPRETTTGTDGRYRLDRLAPGEMSVEVAPAPGSGAVTRHGRTTVTTGRATKLDFPTRVPFRVRLTERGAPRAGATLVLLAPIAGGRLAPAMAAATNEDGFAEFAGSPSEIGVALVAVKHGDSAVFMSLPRARPGSSPQETPTVDLSGRSARGIVVSAENGSPLPGARLSCARSGGGVLQLNAERGPLWFPALQAQVVFETPASVAATDHDGRFDFWLPDWCDEVVVAGPEPGDQETPWGVIRRRREDLPPRAAARITLERGHLIVVSVGAEDGSILPPVEVTLHHPGSGTPLSSVGLRDGVARLATDGAGPWIAVGRARGFAPAMTAPLPTPDSAPVRVDLELERGGLLLVETGPGVSPNDGVATGAEAVAHPAPVRITDVDGRDWTPFVEKTPGDGGGTTTFGPLPRGRYIVALGEIHRTATLRGEGDVRVVRLRD